MKNRIINLTMLTILFLIPALPILAQPTLPTPPGGAPIDGGLSLLIAGGVGYGVKKIRENRKKQQ